ncbi:sigma factor-like helix-turn-helix DNA-binding protein [Streptomyces sp. NPDC058052]|uniref:sigma factor-like helix-turn-helix DNA-binding protein n=1 Tax=Streptomyces sp. NPDC058052 TaxID=3346316 RepID=UPI0036EF7870
MLGRRGAGPAGPGGEAPRAAAPRQRAAVCLHHRYNMDDRRIAERIGCTRATVRSHLPQARAAKRLASTVDRT